MGMGVPLLNEYKQEFFLKRFPQTILGGLKLRLGYDAPVYVYLNQVVLFLFPLFWGGLFTLLVELSLMVDYIAVCVYGGLIFVFVLVCQILTTVVEQQQSSQALAIKQNLLSEEDEIDFMSCCAGETWHFVIPAKKIKFNIFFHALISGPMCGLTLWYLLPVTLNRLYSDNIVATVILFILGWITLCIGQYSLTVGSPPELATFQTLDTYELSPLMRPFYIFVCLTFDVVARYMPEFGGVNSGLHIVFVCLPLLWTLGLLPPIDALFLWLFEQSHVFLLGGSHSASNTRLFVLVLLSMATFSAVYLIPMGIGSILVAAGLGYILSTDISGLGTQLWCYIRSRNKVHNGDTEQITVSAPHGFLWTWGFREFLYHICMFIIVVGESAILNIYAATISEDVWKILGYLVIAFCIVEKVLRDMQSAFIFFGLFRNKLFPNSVQRISIFKREKGRLKFLGIARRVLMNWIAPFTMVAYLSLRIASSDPLAVSIFNGLDTFRAVCFAFGIVRAFRWTWQNTTAAMLELTIVHIVYIVDPSNATVQAWGLPILLLVAGFCRDRSVQILNKLYCFFVILITSWTDKKQRRRSTAAILFLSFLLFPLIFCEIVLASVLAAPLLPLFTLPLFLIGFPRPLKFWPAPVGASASVCSDTVYYKQFTPQFAGALRIGFADGSLGDPVPGNHYLVRYQDRMAWVMVLERGSGYCTVSIKGLELQETSCHTVEATQLDDMFENAFEVEGGFPIVSLNKNAFHTLTPLDAAVVKTYSDARNVLTGLIDTPDSYSMTMSAFVKSLVWLLLHHVKALKMLKAKTSSDAGMKINSRNKDEKTIAAAGKKKTIVDSNDNGISSVVKSNCDIKTEGKKIHGAENAWIDSRPTSPEITKPRRKSSWTSSLNSFTDSIWSVEDETKTVEMSTFSTKAGERSNAKTQAKTVNQPKDDIDDLIADLDFGLPALDISSKPKYASPSQMFTVGKKSYVGDSIYKPQTNLAGSPDFKCPHSSKLSLPPKWRELPIDQSRLTKLQSQFPRDWYNHVLSTLDWSDCGDSGQVVSEVSGDDLLAKSYFQLVMACYSVFDNQASHNSAPFLYKSYVGDIPWNAMLDWLSEDKDLHAVVIKAFRYGFKMMLDQLLLGEISSHGELQEILEEYDRDWYIGLETDPGWKVAVLENKPNLFSLVNNSTQGTYGSRLLTQQDVPVSIGRLNAEVIRAQWANLSLELLYFTNDDEERYSIQAHPTILRNLTVQAADPPLGYPIFASEPITIPTL